MEANLRATREPGSSASRRGQGVSHLARRDRHRAGLCGRLGPDFYDSGRQAARLVFKILKGEKPANIPVETSVRIELAINLKAAKALKVQVGQALLQRADRIIE